MSSIGPLVGEHLALDLVNTRVNMPPLGRLDLLDSSAALRVWLGCESGRLPRTVTVGRSSATGADLEPIRAVREHAAIAIGAARVGSAPPAAALHGLNQAQREAPMIRELRWTGSAVSAAERREGSLGQRLAAHLAESVADLLVDPRVGTIKKCEQDFCVLWFLPTNPRRRWCNTRICGNRARVSRHYHRHKRAAAESAVGG